MFCKKCGTPNEDGARFCRKCGEPLGGDEKQGGPQGTDRQSGRYEPGPAGGQRNGQGPAPGRRDGYEQRTGTGRGDGYEQRPGTGRSNGYEQRTGTSRGDGYEQRAGTGRRGGYDQGAGTGRRNGLGQGPAQGRNNRYEPEAAHRAQDEEKARIRKRLIAAICTVGVLLLICAGTGIFFLVSGNSAQAEKKFQDKITSGDKYVEELDYTNAIDAFQNAIEIEPKKIEGYEKLADVYMKQEEYEKAEETLIKGIQTIQGSTVLQEKLEEVYEHIEPADPDLVLPTEAPKEDPGAGAQPQKVTEEPPAASESQQAAEETQTGAGTSETPEEPQTESETPGLAGEMKVPDEIETETETETADSEDSPETESETAANEPEGADVPAEPVPENPTEEEVRAAYQEYIGTMLASDVKLASTEDITYTWGGNAKPPVEEAGGLISAYEADLDGDGILEMLTVSYTYAENGLGDKMPATVVELYALENGTVTDKGTVVKSLEAGSLSRFEEKVKIFIKDTEGKKYICFYGSAMSTMLANGPQLSYSIWTYEGKEIKNECDFNFIYNRSDFPADVKEKLNSLGLPEHIGEILPQNGLVMITELYSLAESTDQAGAEVPATATFTDYTDLKTALGNGQSENGEQTESQPEGQTEDPSKGQTEEGTGADNGIEGTTEVPGTDGQPGTEPSAEGETGQEAAEGSADTDAAAETQITAEIPQTEAPVPEPENVVYEALEFAEIQEYNGNVYTVFSDGPDGWFSTSNDAGGNYLDKLAVYNDYIYVIRMYGTGAMNGTLERSRLDGSETTVLADNIYGWGRVWIIGDWLYYATSTAEEVNSDLMRINLSDTSVIEQLPCRPYNLVTDGSYIYFNYSWESSMGNKSSLDGSVITELTFPLPLDTVYNNGRFYYCENQAVSSMNTDGSDYRLEVSGQQLNSMKIYEGNIYYVDTEQVYRKTIDTSDGGVQLSQLPEGLHAKDVLAGAGGSIYVRCYMDDVYKQAHPEIPDQLFNIAMYRIPAAGGEAEAVGYWFQS